MVSHILCSSSQIIVTTRLRTDLRACALSIESCFHSNARSTAYSALTSPAVAGVQAPRKHAAAVVNLQQLEGSLKPQDSGRFGQACPEHRVRLCSVLCLSRTCPCPAGRCTCDLALYHPVFSHRISRRHPLPVAACLRMTSSVWHLQLSNPTHKRRRQGVCRSIASVMRMSISHGEGDRRH